LHYTHHPTPVSPPPSPSYTPPPPRQDLILPYCSPILWKKKMIFLFALDTQGVSLWHFHHIYYNLSLSQPSYEHRMTTKAPGNMSTFTTYSIFWNQEHFFKAHIRFIFSVHGPVLSLMAVLECGYLTFWDSIIERKSEKRFWNNYCFKQLTISAKVESNLKQNYDPNIMILTLLSSFHSSIAYVDILL
jgi:hypothetical protein